MISNFDRLPFLLQHAHTQTQTHTFFCWHITEMQWLSPLFNSDNLTWLTVDLRPICEAALGGCHRTYWWMLGFLLTPGARVGITAQWICTHSQGASPPGISHPGYNSSCSSCLRLISALEVGAYSPQHAKSAPHFWSIKVSKVCRVFFRIIWHICPWDVLNNFL